MLKHGNALSSGQLRQMLSILASQFPLDMDTEVADGWIKNPIAVGQVLRDGLCSSAVSNTKMITGVFPVTVDYTQTLDQMIAAGKYDSVNSDITDKHFPSPSIPTGLPPSTGSGQATKAEIKLELVPFNRTIGSNEAIQKLEQQGLRPATIHELLVFGATYPEEQRKFPVVALGSVWQYWYDNRYVPYLCSNDSRRSMDLHWFGYGWNDNYRFAVVRK